MENKILKKIVNLFGYKLIEKKHVKNDRILSDKTVLNINAVLKSIFEKKNIKTIIQIGANDGLSFDELNYFIKKYKSKSILVEPIFEIFKKLQENYKEYQNIFFENSAITVDEDIKHLFKVNKKFLNKYGNHIPAISSFDKNHLIKHGVKSSHIIKENVKTLSIKDLIEKYQLEDLDLFFVDAEGYDGKIVFDLLVKSNLRPIIIFEYIHIENNFFKKLINLFKDKNFSYFNIGECLIVFPKEEKIEIFF
jgi:FkbM family methyltransferase